MSSLAGSGGSKKGSKLLDQIASAKAKSAEMHKVNMALIDAIRVEEMKPLVISQTCEEKQEDSVEYSVGRSIDALAGSGGSEVESVGGLEGSVSQMTLNIVGIRFSGQVLEGDILNASTCLDNKINISSPHIFGSSFVLGKYMGEQKIDKGSAVLGIGASPSEVDEVPDLQEASSSAAYRPPLPCSYKYVFNDVCEEDSNYRNESFDRHSRMEQEDGNKVWDTCDGILDPQYPAEIRVIRPSPDGFTKEQILDHIDELCGFGDINHVVAVVTVESGDLILSGVSTSAGYQAITY